MKQGLCVYPGSFDPITNGHLDVIRRGASLFPRLVVAVLHNPAKNGLFPLEQRLDMIRRACAQLPNVEVDCFDGLLVEYMRKRQAETVLRGLRSASDFENEFQMAQLNHQMSPNVETLFLMTSPEHACLSSSAVREIGMFGGDVSPFVPSCIAQEVQAMLESNRK